MHQLVIPDMTCGHCAATITKALKARDPNARVEFSLPDHLVAVESALTRDEIARLIAKAGYTPKTGT